VPCHKSIWENGCLIAWHVVHLRNRRCVVSFIPWPLYPWWKSTPVAIGYETWQVSELVWMLRRTTASLALPGNEFWFLWCPACSLVVPAELFWFLSKCSVLHILFQMFSWFARIVLHVLRAWHNKDTTMCLFFSISCLFFYIDTVIPSIPLSTMWCQNSYLYNVLRKTSDSHFTLKMAVAPAT
jgi:hypothetical protein